MTSMATRTQMPTLEGELCFHSAPLFATITPAIWSSREVLRVLSLRMA